MSEISILPLILGLVFGGIFFLCDIYHETKHRKIEKSLIAGVTVTYFFVILLTEIETGLEHFPFHLFKYVGILIGFSFIHLTEKFILIHVEKKSQLKLKEICQEAAEISLKEKKIEKSLITTIIGEDDEKNSLIKITERLIALNQISKMQTMCIDKEKNIEEQLKFSNNKNLKLLIKLSSLFQISKIHDICLEEARKFHESLFKKLIEFEEDDSPLRYLSTNLKILEELAKKEAEFLEIKMNLETLFINNYLNPQQNLTKNELTIKSNELKNISKAHEESVISEYELEKGMINTLKTYYSGDDDEFRLVCQVSALRMINKFHELCYSEEKKLEKAIVDGEIDKLSILSKLSALNTISLIRNSYLEEEERLRKLFRETLKESDHSQLSNEYFMEDIKSYEEIRREQKDSLMKERDLEVSLLKGLIDNTQNKLSLLKLTEKLIDLKNTFKFQAECIEKEKVVGASVLYKVMEEGSQRLTLPQIASKLNKFCQHGEALVKEDSSLKIKIQNNINEYLNLTHQYTNFGYHILVGIILYELLAHNLITAILFFVFALFKAFISKTSNKIQLFPDIEIKSEHHEPLYMKIFFASSALIGVLIGLFLTVVFHISMEIIFLLFSFISGVILYTIIREVLPENESGKPLYFLLGIIIFIVIIISFESILSFFHH